MAINYQLGDVGTHGALIRARAAPSAGDLRSLPLRSPARRSSPAIGGLHSAAVPKCT